MQIQSNLLLREKQFLRKPQHALGLTLDKNSATVQPVLVMAHSLQSHATAVPYAEENGRRDHFWSQLYSLMFSKPF